MALIVKNMGFFSIVWSTLTTFMTKYNGYKKVDETTIDFIDLETGKRDILVEPINKSSIIGEITRWLMNKYINLVDLIGYIQSLFNPIDFSIGTISNTPLGLFKVGMNLLESKTTFLIVVLLTESLGLIVTWAMLSEQVWLIILAPILVRGTEMLTSFYFINLDYQIQCKWKDLAYTYFDSLSYPSRKNTKPEEFRQQVEQTGWTFVRFVNWVFPTVIKLCVIATNCLVAFYTQSNYLICFYPFLFWFYYRIRMEKKQDELTGIRGIKKTIEKQTRPFTSWNLHLFQNRKKSVDEMINVDKPILEADKKYQSGWQSISQELRLFAEIISSVSIYFISRDIKIVLINKVIFSQLTSTIGYVGNLSSCINNNLKDFDRFMDWSSSVELDPIIEQMIPEFPLQITSSIKLGDFELEASGLSIGLGDQILLRGASGLGKTQLVNSLQGLIPGTSLGSFTCPKSFVSSWEYMNQQTRETIPSQGLTLRQMLESESNNELIIKLVGIVELKTKFPKPESFDIPMDSLSGGERMRLSILYTIWDMEKRSKQILILDEPEQGLDEEIRIGIIQNVLKNISKPCLVIYHGSKLDLLSLPFTKVWEFNKIKTAKQEFTQVVEKTWTDYRGYLVKEILNLIISK